MAKTNTITPDMSVDAFAAVRNWRDNVGKNQGQENYDPHDPSTFVNPYEGIKPSFTPEQLQQHIDSGKFQYDAQWKQFDLWYNSESEKVKRLLAAGLNPDLVGLDSASESSSQPTPLSQAGDLAAKQQELDINRSQMISNTVLGIASTIISACSSIFNIALGIAATSASVAAATAQAAKLKAEKTKIEQDISNITMSLDVASEGMALASALNDMSKGYKDGMTPAQISSLISYDGVFHEDPNINRSIARHKKNMSGNIKYANDFLEQKNTASVNNVKDGILSDYYIPGDEARASLRPLFSTAVDLFVTDSIFQRDFAKFKTAVVNGADEETLYKMINESWKNQLKFDRGIAPHIANKAGSVGTSWHSDFYYQLNQLDLNRGLYGLQTGTMTANNFEKQLSNERQELQLYSDQLVMRAKAQAMISRLQKGYFQELDHVLKKSKNGTINIIDSAGLMMFNSVYQNTYNAVRSFEENTGAQQSVLDGGLGSAALMLGEKFLKIK